MIVTINTDASFNNKHRVGTFAFWIISNEGKITMSGAFRKKINYPQVAEFRCLMNAFHVMFIANWKGVKKVIVNTDCLDVIHLLKNDEAEIKKFKLNRFGKNFRIELVLLLKKNNFNIKDVEFRHVKSHQHTETTRNYVNQWCDDNAKGEMKKVLTKLEK